MKHAHPVRPRHEHVEESSLKPIKRSQGKTRFRGRRLLFESLEPRTVLDVALAGALSGQDEQGQVPNDADPSTILVRFQPGAAQHAAAGTSLGREFQLVPGLRSARLGKGISVDAALNAYRSNPNVLYAEPNGSVHAMLAPNDPFYVDGSLYGIDQISAPAAWDITTGGNEVLVAVIDTGIDYTHPDLNANIWVNAGEIPGNNIDDDANGYLDDVHGYDFVGVEFGGGDGDPFDDHYHGTHVSGTIGAIGNDGAGVVGVNWTTTMAAVKFLDSGGSGSWEAAVAAIEYAVNIGAKLSNNSWGGSSFSAALYDAVKAAGDAGHLFIAASGNNGSDADVSPLYPAGFSITRVIDGVTYPGLDNIISVAATDSADNKADFSNWGLTSSHLGAPGVETLSTMPGGGYGLLSGTSMATPHVAGAAALAWGLAGSSGYGEIRDAILSSVDPITSLRTSGPTPVATGGRLNAFRAVQAVGMAVSGSDPANGSIIAAAPTDFVVHFAHPYDATTIDASDLTVNGHAATSRTLTDSDSVTFQFGASPVAAQGVQTMHIAAGAIAAAGSVGLPDPLLHEWNAAFRYDLLRLAVESSNPAGPIAGAPLTTFEVNLNEPVAPGSAGTSDLSVSQGVVTGVEVLPGETTIRFTLEGITAEGALDVFIAAGALTDPFGNPNLPYSASFTLVTSMAVGGSSPAEGEVVIGPTPPTDFVIHFTLPYDASTVAASDFTVNGIAASSHTLTDSDTVTFQFAASPVTAEGEQTMQIAAGALNADASVGLPDPSILDWTGIFRWDLAPMQVDSTVPAVDSSVLLPFTSIDINLSEAVLPSSVEASDLQLSQGSVAGFTLENGGTTIRFALTGIASEGVLSGAIAYGALADVYGNPNVEFLGTYTLDIGTVPFPTPLSPVGPLGSLIYSQVAPGIIGAVGDSDSFTIDVAAGQTITLLVTPTGTLQPTATLGAFSVAATAPGKQALLQTIAVGGLQTFTVGALGDTTGGYSLQVLLNAALESESHDGESNDVTPQNLDASFITVETSTVGALRGAVMGRTDATDPVVTVLTTNFDSTADFVATGLWHQSIGHRNEPGHSSTQSMYFGAKESYRTNRKGVETFTKGSYEVKSKGKIQPVSGTLTSRSIDVPIGGLITVDFNYILQTQGSETVDLAELQIKPSTSSTWTTLEHYNGRAESSAWRAADPVDISAYSGQTVQIRFNFASNNTLNSFEGWYVDDVLVRQTKPHDVYSLSVAEGERVTVALASIGDVRASLQNAAGAVTLATGAAGPSNLRNLINSHGPLAAGTYRLSITGQTNSPYTLVVLRNAAFDAENNDSYDTAQDFSGVPGVLGHVTAGTDLLALHGAPVSGGLLLIGSKISLGIAADGSFITGATGIQFLGNEFVIPGSPVAGFTIGQAGSNYTNKAALGTTDITISMEDLSSGTIRGVRIEGTVGGNLLLERVIAFAEDDEFVTIATRLTNLSGATIDNVAWLENLDPDQGEPLGVSFDTFNDVVLGGQFVRADARPAGFPDGLTIGMGSADARRVVSAQGFDNRDPFEIINAPVDPDGAPGDIGINLAFNFGSLAPGQSESGAMIMTFGRTTAEAEATYSVNTGGTLVTDEDWYLHTVGPDGILHVETSTPGDGAGQPGNSLNPRIEAFGASSAVPLYAGVPFDGRNELIHVTGLVPGTIYRVRISAEDGTGGAYFLDPPPAASSGADSILVASALPTAGRLARDDVDPYRAGSLNAIARSLSEPASSDLVEAVFASSLKPEAVDLALTDGEDGEAPDWLDSHAQFDADHSRVDLAPARRSLPSKPTPALQGIGGLPTDAQSFTGRVIAREGRYGQARKPRGLATEEIHAQAALAETENQPGGVRRGLEAGLPTGD